MAWICRSPRCRRARGIRDVGVLYPQREGDGSRALCREVDGVAGGIR